jgi:hypothetical protein
MWFTLRAEDTDDIVGKIEEFFMNLNVNVMLRINDEDAGVVVWYTLFLFFCLCDPNEYLSWVLRT